MSERPGPDPPSLPPRFPPSPPDGGAIGPLEDGRGGWKALLRNRRFLLLEASGTLAGAGYAVYSVSVLFLAYGLSGNLLVAGTVLFIEYGVYAATFIIAPIVDRVRDKRSILLACFPVQAGAAGLLAFELRSGGLTEPVLLGIVLVLALLWDFVWAVFMIAPRIVLEKRQLFLGEGFSSALSVGTQIGGYSGGGALLYFVGPFGGASVYAILRLAATLAALPLALPVDRAPQTRFWETFRRGWDAFRGRAGRSLRAFSGLEVFLGFFASVPALLLPAIAYQHFASPASVYGALVTAFALGGSFAGIGIGHLNPRRRVGTLLVLTPLLAGGCVLLLDPLSVSAVALVLLLAGVGGAFSVRYSAKYSWVQGTYPAEELGRLTSNLYLFTGISGTASVLVVGVLSTRVPLGTLELGDGLGLVAGGLLALAIPFVRRMAF